MKKLLLTAAAFGLFALPTQAQAQIEKYTFDKAHTQILFFVNHLGFSMSQGEFHDYDGHFIIDRGEPANSSVQVQIMTESIDMDDEKWDAHMKNEDFFDVEKFPTMTFDGQKVDVTGENTANVTGDLTLLGVTKPVTLAVTHNKSDVHPFSGKYVAGFSATGTINRSDFGMTYGVPGVAEEVQVRIEVEGVRHEEAGEGTQNK